ncbi:MAG: hypothetical protein PHI63_03855 [Patescibacteria group bacterium]|nr:hypothetical protein [Patescibacteria group bacterium]
MNIHLNQIITRSDWVKIIILLVVAAVAWYQVFTLYSQPFDLTFQIQREKAIREYESTTLPPIGAPTPRVNPSGGEIF